MVEILVASAVKLEVDMRIENINFYFNKFWYVCFTNVKRVYF